MAITQAMCTSFKAEIMLGVHDFRATGGDTFKLALYTSSASLDANTTAYSSTNEASSANYTAGGGALTNLGVVTSNDTSTLYDKPKVAPEKPLLPARTCKTLAGWLDRSPLELVRDIKPMYEGDKFNATGWALNVPSLGSFSAPNLGLLGKVDLFGAFAGGPKVVLGLVLLVFANLLSALLAALLERRWRPRAVLFWGPLVQATLPPGMKP